MFESLTSPLEVPPLAGLISSDRTAAMAVGRISGETPEIEAKVTALEPLLAQLAIDHPGLRVMPLRARSSTARSATLVSNDLDGSLRLTLPITFLILLLAFGTVIAGLVPIVLAVTALIGAFGLMGIYSQTVEPVSQYASQVVVLIGLAVAIDYSLFLISRFRSERRAGRGVEEAIEVASSTAGRAVFFSGLAVAISLAGLLLMDNSIFRSIAIATISVVLDLSGRVADLPACHAGPAGSSDRLAVDPVLRRRPGRGHERLGPSRAPGDQSSGGGRRGEHRLPAGGSIARHAPAPGHRPASTACRPACRACRPGSS